MVVEHGFEIFPPFPGPSSPTPPRPCVKWVEVTCTCGTVVHLRAQEVLPLARHVASCARLHARTGRGDALTTCGDVEENPGPSSNESLGIVVRVREPASPQDPPSGVPPQVDGPSEDASLAGLGLLDLVPGIDLSALPSLAVSLPPLQGPCPRDPFLPLPVSAIWTGDAMSLRAGSLPSSLPGPCRHQHWWTHALDLARFKDLAASAVTRDRVRLAAQRQPHAGVWLVTPPSAALKTRIPGVQWQCLLRWWLGMPIIPSAVVGQPCPQCSQPVDSRGDHAVCCIKNNILRRHMALQESLQLLLLDAGFSCDRERGYGDGSRAADLLVHRWDADGPAAIDLTVRCPVAPPITPSGMLDTCQNGGPPRKRTSAPNMRMGATVRAGPSSPFWWTRGVAWARPHPV